LQLFEQTFFYQNCYTKILSKLYFSKIQKELGFRVPGDRESLLQANTKINMFQKYSTFFKTSQVGSLASKPKRDLLMMDFWEMETISFPPEGSSITPAHHYSEFRFKIYAPIAFRYFRDLFGIQPDDFMVNELKFHVISQLNWIFYN
jgi:hypothetical protein